MRAALQLVRRVRLDFALERRRLVRSLASKKLVLAAILGLVLLAAIVVSFEASTGIALQLMYVPILLAAAVFGSSAAIVAGSVAAVDAIAQARSGLTDVSIAQSVLYVGFAVVSGWLFRAVGEADDSTSNFQQGPSKWDGTDRVLESLARTVEVRDHHTQGHCRRVARNAGVLGRALGLTDDELGLLRWSALLHDIGKIAVPEYILLKNGRLSESEYAEIRRHPAYGADLLASVSREFRPIADVVRAHHERWDGLGYPLGYRGPEIPRLARIIAIVDVFEALTSERPYRSPMPVDQALQYVLNGAGTQFDPAMIPVFRELVEAGRIECSIRTSGTELRSPISAESTARLSV